jgi:hypothetical protein
MLSSIFSINLSIFKKGNRKIASTAAHNGQKEEQSENIPPTATKQKVSFSFIFFGERSKITCVF